MADQVKWPVCHPMLCQVLDCHTGSPIHARWLSPSNGCVIPDPIADELNRLATVDACFAMMRTKGMHHGDSAIATDAATILWSPLHHPNHLIALHARLTKETT